MIFVLKTSVRTKNDVEELKLSSSDIFEQARWSFDLDDCDKVLRIDSKTDILSAVIRLLQDKGFDCEELD
jgi:hypothetical protein